MSRKRRPSSLSGGGNHWEIWFMSVPGQKGSILPARDVERTRSFGDLRGCGMRAPIGTVRSVCRGAGSLWAEGSGWIGDCLVDGRVGVARVASAGLADEALKKPQHKEDGGGRKGEADDLLGHVHGIAPFAYFRCGK